MWVFVDKLIFGRHDLLIEESIDKCLDKCMELSINQTSTTTSLKLIISTKRCASFYFCKY